MKQPKTVLNRENTKVVIRYYTIFEKWFICHEKSYQSAFSRDYNGFDTRENAVKFAESNDLEVVIHPFDKMQKFAETATDHT